MSTAYIVKRKDELVKTVEELNKKLQGFIKARDDASNEIHKIMTQASTLQGAYAELVNQENEEKKDKKHG